MGEDVLPGVRVAEGHVLQTEFIGMVRNRIQALSRFEEERFRVFQAFPYTGQIQSLAVQGEQII